MGDRYGTVLSPSNTLCALAYPRWKILLDWQDGRDRIGVDAYESHKRSVCSRTPARHADEIRGRVGAAAQRALGCWNSAECHTRTATRGSVVRNCSRGTPGTPSSYKPLQHSQCARSNVLRVGAFLVFKENMTKVILAASLAAAALMGCAVVPYGPGPFVGVGVYAAPPPAVYVYPRSYGYYGYPAYRTRGYYGPHRW
jgi:hypothetical protein